MLDFFSSKAEYCVTMSSKLLFTDVIIDFLIWEVMNCPLNFDY